MIGRVSAPLLIALAAFLPLSPAHPHPFTYQATIVSVYDGDTVTVDIDLGFNIFLKNQTSRLFCVDTPEVRGDEKVQGLAVRDQVRLWLPVGAVVEFSSIKDRTGKFGRWLAILRPLGWSESVNRRLLDRNMAEIEAYSASQRAECAVLP